MMEQEMEKISMLKIKEVFHLKYESKRSSRKIARALNVSHTVVNRYVRRFESLSLSYEELIVFFRYFSMIFSKIVIHISGLVPGNKVSSRIRVVFI